MKMSLKEVEEKRKQEIEKIVDDLMEVDKQEKVVVD